MENKQNTEEIIEEEILEDYIDIYDVSDLEVKPAWQAAKEEVYSNINITVKQLDIIIGLAVAGLVILGIVIGLDAAGVF